MKPMQGLSLLEALVALTLAALLAAVAVPAFAAARLRIQLGQIELALSESVLAANRVAVAGGIATVMCPAAAGDCGDGPDWSPGWLVFADLDHDRRFGPHDVLIRREPALASALAMHGARGRARLVFQPGAGNAGSNTSFVVCARSGTRGARLVLSGYGRFRTAPADPSLLAACRSDGAG